MSVVDDILAASPAGRSRWPTRIACLTEETTETLFRLGCGDLVVGVSSFTVRPEEAKQKARVSSFLDANFDKLTALKPDLVVGFSDLQADIARELAKRAIPVVIFNQRSVAEILQTIVMTGALVGKGAEAEALARGLEQHLRDVEEKAKKQQKKKPRVFFEEWPDPVISGIRWVSELIEIAGGVDVCAHTRAHPEAKGRIVDVSFVVEHDPEIICASWCGKRVDFDSINTRYAATTAVKTGRVVEIPSEIILQPGPAALSDGVDALQRAFA